MWDWPLIAVVFLTIVTLLVAAHELGHYLFARLFKMGVEEFSIGFGKKPIWTWMERTYVNEQGETETTVFTIRPWPLGGFVKIKGMVPEEDGSETRIPGGFYSKPPHQRFLTLFAGPVFSLIAGWLVLIPVLTFYGMRQPVNKPVLGSLVKGFAAHEAGLLPGDHVLSIDGRPVTTWHEMSRRVQDSEGKPQSFLIERNGRQIAYAVRPRLEPDASPVLGPDLEPTAEQKRQFKIGAAYKSEISPRDLGSAMTDAAVLPFKMAAGLVNLAKQPSRFKDEVGGPASIVAATAASARAGLWPTVWLAGLLSMSLGIFNLLPVYPLDGGQMAVAFLEMFRKGRRLSFRVQNWVAGVGFVLVAMLFLSVIAVDVNRFLPGAGEKDKIEVVTEAKSGK